MPDVNPTYKPLPQTIEDVLAIEGAALTGWTSDSQEAFMAPYEGGDPFESQLDELARVAREWAVALDDIHTKTFSSIDDPELVAFHALEQRLRDLALEGSRE